MPLMMCAAATPAAELQKQQQYIAASQQKTCQLAVFAEITASTERVARTSFPSHFYFPA